MAAKIDLEKIVCSMLDDNHTTHLLCKEGLLRALEDQGLEYKDGKLEHVKLEPQYFPGDWVIWECDELEKILQIEEVNYDKKHYKFTDGTTLPFVDEYCLHKWTYKDAQNGDVLSTVSGDIVIFKEGNYDTFNSSMTVHCCYDSLNDNIGCYSISNINPTFYLPATNEQKQKLYKKLAEVGYEWVPEYKRLRTVPIFKPNDVIRWKINGRTCCIERIDEHHQRYWLSNGTCLLYEDQKDYELVAKKIEKQPTQEGKHLIVYRYNASNEDVIKKLSFLTMKYPTRVFLDFYDDGKHSESILFSLDDVLLFLYFNDKDEELQEFVEKDYVLNSKWYDTDSFDMPAVKMERLVKATKNTKMLLMSLQRTNDRLVQDVKNFYTK